MKYQSGMLMDQVGRINYEKYNFARQDFQSFLLRKTIFPRDSFEKNSFHYYFVCVLLCVYAHRYNKFWISFLYFLFS